MSGVAENLDFVSMSPIGEPIVEDFLAAHMRNELLEDKLGNAKVNRFEVDTRLRTHLTYIFSTIILLWLIAVIFVLLFNNNLLHFRLSDEDLITLLTTTSVNVIGMMLIILKNLFPGTISKD